MRAFSHGVRVPSPISIANVKVLLGRFPTFIFSSPRFVYLPAPLFVSLTSSVTSCCYCSLMRPQSGQNCGGFVETWKKRVTRSFSTSRFQYFSQHFPTSISRPSRYSTRQCMHALYRCKFSSRTRTRSPIACATFFLSSTNTAARLSSGYIPSWPRRGAGDSSNPSGFHVCREN